jgi:hypothetical protein
VPTKGPEYEVVMPMSDDESEPVGQEGEPAEPDDFGKIIFQPHKGLEAVAPIRRGLFTEIGSTDTDAAAVAPTDKRVH